LKGKIINGLEVCWPKTIFPLLAGELLKRIGGQTIIGVARRAKILIIKLASGEQLLIHLKMTGQLIYAPGKAGAKALPLGEGGVGLIVGGHPQPHGTENLPNKFTRVVLSFGDKSKLFFNDLRKFGWMKLLTTEEATKLLAAHGVEPLGRDFTEKHFAELLSRYLKRQIKQVLLDQTIIAGLGNIYADEVCFFAKIRPTRIVKSLKDIEKKNLHRGIISVLKLSIRKKGTSSNNYRRSDGSQGNFFAYLKVYGRAGEKCQRCWRAIIHKIKLSGRGTHFCPGCQK